MEEIEKLYSNLGGRFITPYNELKKKCEGIKAFIFDWDGVFNNGQKSFSGGSNFSEVDSMGTNLMRYSYYLKNDSVPITAVISGEKNDSAFYFCERECFHYSFYKVSNKLEALHFLCNRENISSKEVAYVFDDVLDISIAEVCGLRLQVNQKANPLFVGYCIKNKLVDYLTSSNGGEFAVREATELIIGMNGNFDAVINSRKNFDKNYQTYLELRKATKTEFFTLKAGVIENVSQSSIGYKL